MLHLVMNKLPPGRSKFLSCFSLVEKTLGRREVRGELKKINLFIFGL